MHLHSFTYDYHLRSIHSYVSGHQAMLKQGYHITRFLDDFLKYYSKAPNFARNLVHAGNILELCKLYFRIVTLLMKFKVLTEVKMVMLVFDDVMAC